MWRSVELDRSLLGLSERLTAEFAHLYPAGAVIAEIGRCADRVGRVSESRFPDAPVEQQAALVEQAVRARLTAPPVPAQRAPRRPLVAAG